MKRIELHNKLVDILGSANVYFQPPASIKLKYPCIIYSLYNMDTEFGDNEPYTIEKRYEVTVITKDPDSNIPIKLAHMPKCIMNRAFTVDNLNHYVFLLYF